MEATNHHVPRELQLMSDLHLEILVEGRKTYDTFEIPNKAPHLALLGDIGKVSDDEEYFGFLLRNLRKYRTVLLVPGNHEAYQSDWPSTISDLNTWVTMNDADESPDKGKLVVLNRTEFRPENCPGTVILGCSLFSHIPVELQNGVSNSLNDFWITSGWNVPNHNAAHRRDLDWLNATVATLEGQEDVERIIILTHWSPSTDPRAIEPKHMGSPVSCAFSTDLSAERCFVSSKVKVWAFGHTHFNCDFEVEREGEGAGPLRLLANQRGYDFAMSDGFDVEKTVAL